MFQTLQDNFNNNSQHTNYWPQQPLSANALALINIINQQHIKSCLVIEESVIKANQMWQALGYFSDESIELLYFPDYETLPYDIFSPNQDIISQRLTILNKLLNNSSQQGKKLIVVGAIDTFIQRLPPTSFILGNSFDWQKGDDASLQQLCNRFAAAGYQNVSSVKEHGEFCIRGSLLDIFPMGSQYPLRLDFFDDELDSLRLFDPETQLTITKIDTFQLLPAHEYILTDKVATQFKTSWFQYFEQEKSEPLRLIDQQKPFPGIESYLPLLHTSTSSIIDYLTDDTLIVQNHRGVSKYEQYWLQIQQRYEEYPNQGQRPPLPPNSLYIPTNEWNASIKNHQKISLNNAKASLVLAAPIDKLELKHQQDEAAVAQVKKHLSTINQVIFCVSSQSRQEWLTNFFKPHNINLTQLEHWQQLNHQDGYFITIAPLIDGFETQQLSIITEYELLGGKIPAHTQQITRTPKTKTQGKGERLAQHYIRNLLELEKGETVVHLEHGVGQYMGLETLTVKGQSDEFLIIHYADNDKLYVPVASLHLISKYISSQHEDAVKLHKLGGDRWQKSREKASKIIRDSAAELLTIYAKRETKQGEIIECKTDSFQQFSDEFIYQETQDQLDAIVAITDDMKRPQPMDRLVCGDVGFGKTEVAMRAAFIATSANRQVLVLVPTTLLASQHLETFTERFANWPVNIDSMSRLQSATEAATSIKRFNEGKTDILIGTHKLLFADLDYKRLSLLVIDEEHRFGVRQKEKLKGLRAQVDILALTATPIPRSLNMALASMRDLSIIAEPPAKRLSIKTFVCIYDLGIIKEAIQRELHRGGQVYFLHNEIKTIERTAEAIAKLIPEATIAVGHGQMKERELEQVMFDFHQQRSHVLVCSTIIETGIDNPNANTIIMERADKLGLAQLHQLRGRVGRSYHQAYAYLLTPEPVAMSKDARKRLDAIQMADHLGSGFTLATQDLEIRGAGELLGDQQSGQINVIGFDLFRELLDKAVNDLRQGNISEDFDKKQTIEINLALSALIPNDYLPDVTLRLGFYKRIAVAKTKQELEDVEIQMKDRFGLLPDEVNYLLAIAQLRQICEKLGIEKIIGTNNQCKFWITSNNQIEPIRVVQLIQKQAQQFSMVGANTIVFSGSDQYSLELPAERIDAAFYVIDMLTGKQIS